MDVRTWAEGAVGVVEEAWEGMLASFCSSGQRQAFPAFIICHNAPNTSEHTRRMHDYALTASGAKPLEGHCTARLCTLSSLCGEAVSLDCTDLHLPQFAT